MGCSSSHMVTSHSIENFQGGFQVIIGENFAASNGAIKLRILIDRTRNSLVVRVKQGCNFKDTDTFGISDPYVKAHFTAFANQTRKTTVKANTVHPVWDEELRWDINHVTNDQLSSHYIILSVWDEDNLKADDFLGKMTLPVAQILACTNEDWYGWFALLDSKNGEDSFAYLGMNWTPEIPKEFGIDRCPTMAVDDEDEDDLSIDQSLGGSQTIPENLGSTNDLSDPLTKTTSGLNFKRSFSTRFSAAAREKAQILALAKELGDAREDLPPGSRRRHITIVYNPVSGSGTAKKILDRWVTPVFRAAKVEYDVVPTQYAGFAIEYTRELNISHTDGLLIAGGDGLVKEVVTGYCLRVDGGGGLPLGIIPSGTANAMAHELHQQKSHKAYSVVGWAALAAARGTTRKIDCLKIANDIEDVYALSVLGWGLAGAVALTAAKLRWIPGQKRVRYDLAGLVTMIGSWPVLNQAHMEFLIEEENEQTGEITRHWLNEDISLINMLVTNLSWLGLDHPIVEGVTPDSGKFAVVLVDGKASRSKVIELAMAMKKGKFMADVPGVRSFYVSEVKITPKENTKTPYNIDGDPLDPIPIHIQCLKQYITVFAEPPNSLSSTTKASLQSNELIF